MTGIRFIHQSWYIIREIKLHPRGVAPYNMPLRAGYFWKSGLKTSKSDDFGDETTFGVPQIFQECWYTPGMRLIFQN